MEILKHVPKLSTDTIGFAINAMVSKMPKDQCYLNVGVWHGFSLLAGMVNNENKRCIGVDNFSQLNGPREEFMKRFKSFNGELHEFYDMDYEEYFKNHHKGDIGVYFYDGNHEYEHQLKGLELAEPFFADGCLILVDDTNWEGPRKATMDFMSRGNYKLLMDKVTSSKFSDMSKGNDINPVYWNGIMLYRKTKASSEALVNA